MNTIPGLELSMWIHAHAPIILLVVLWTLFWTALGLWNAAKRGHTIWFLVFLLIHTLGILEIFYLFFILKLKFSEVFKR